MSNLIEDIDEDYFQEEEFQGSTTTKFLTFLSDSLLFGVDAANVTEIIRNYNVTILPKVPDYISGILNLRGQIIPIIDMRTRMGKPKMENSNDACIIVINMNSVNIGILVDAVSQVIDIDQGKIMPPPYDNCGGIVNGIISLPTETMLSLDCECLINTF